MPNQLLHIDILSALSDNYVYMIHNGKDADVACVDPSEAEPVLRYLNETQRKLTHIFNTHHHWDHTDGNHALKDQTGCKVFGPSADRERIPKIDRAFKDGESFVFLGEEFEVIDIPGHTKGHIALWASQSMALFCGDTLFSLGCGRMFEGTPKQMWGSLLRLRGLPDEAQVYCGHEYTIKNAEFALNIEPRNEGVVQRLKQAHELRSKGFPTVPSSLGEEKKLNPFLRSDQPEICEAVGLEPGASASDVFARLRAMKDEF